MTKPSSICVVPECKNNNLNKSVSFHSFPKDASLAAKWLENIDRPNWTPKPRSLVCSSHFTNDSFQYHPEMIRTYMPKKTQRLLKSAIPTIFLKYPPRRDNLPKTNPTKKVITKDKYIQVHSRGTSVRTQTRKFTRHKECQTEKTVQMVDVGTQTYSNSISSTMIEDEMSESESDISVDDPLDTSYSPSSLDLEDTSHCKIATRRSMRFLVVQHIK